jgi:hypothetical protein
MNCINTLLWATYEAFNITRRYLMVNSAFWRVKENQGTGTGTGFLGILWFCRDFYAEFSRESFASFTLGGNLRQPKFPRFRRQRIAASCRLHCWSLCSMCEPTGLPPNTAWHATWRLRPRYAPWPENWRKHIIFWMNAELVVGTCLRLR